MPSGGKPISAWQDPNEAFLDIVDNIRKILVELVLSSSPGVIKQKEQWLQEGDANHIKKQYGSALVAYEQAIRLDPRDASSIYKKGLTLHRLGQLQLALTAYKQAIKCDKYCTSAYIGLGEVYYFLGDYKQAEKNFDMVLRLDPNLNWIKIKRENIPFYLSKKDLIQGRYEILEGIAIGHMANVYKGWDHRLERIVVIKQLHQTYNADPKAVERFSREAKAAAIPHPHIVQTYDFIKYDNGYFIIMEYVGGPNLRQVLSHGARRLQIKEAIVIAYHIALSLKTIHSIGIVHRDIKPQNIYAASLFQIYQELDLPGRKKYGALLNSDDAFTERLKNKDLTWKLGDFGIVKLYNGLHNTQLTTTGMILGTVQYCSPEQLQGIPISPSTDIYSLGVIMYEMLTNRPLFVGSSALDVSFQHITDSPPLPHMFNTDIPTSLEAIVMNCLEKNPKKRFKDGLEMTKALRATGLLSNYYPFEIE